MSENGKQGRPQLQSFIKRPVFQLASVLCGSTHYALKSIENPAVLPPQESEVVS